MPLNSRNRLAVSSMVDLGLRVRNGPVALAALARRLHVSLSGLEQLFAQLRTAGLVQSTLGPGGGYRLARDAATISVATIVAAVDAGTRAVRDGADRYGLSSSLEQGLQTTMQAHMAGIALADLVAGQLESGVVVEVRARPLPMAPRGQPGPITDRVANSVFALGAMMARSAARPGNR